MANPQCEHGYTTIANEIIEKLCSHRIAGQEWQVLWVIVRKTWGFKKKQDMIPLSQFSKSTGIPRRKIPSLLNSLVEKNIISKSVTNKGDRQTILYGIQKDYDRWEVSPKKVTDPGVSPIKVQGVPNKGVKSVPNKGALKRKEKKLSKEKIYCFNPCVVAITHQLLNSLLAKKPNFKQPTKARLDSWYKEIDLMIRADNRHPNEIREAINWLFNENWEAEISFVVESPKSLRKKFDRIQIQMQKPTKRFL